MRCLHIAVEAFLFAVYFTRAAQALCATGSYCGTSPYGGAPIGCYEPWTQQCYYQTPGDNSTFVICRLDAACCSGAVYGQVVQPQCTDTYTPACCGAKAFSGSAAAQCCSSPGNASFSCPLDTSCCCASNLQQSVPYINGYPNYPGKCCNTNQRCNPGGRGCWDPANCTSSSGYRCGDICCEPGYTCCTPPNGSPTCLPDDSSSQKRCSGMCYPRNNNTMARTRINNFLKHWEQCRTKAYCNFLSSANAWDKWTVGWGFTNCASADLQKAINCKTTMTQEQADRFLRRLVDKKMAELSGKVADWDFMPNDMRAVVRSKLLAFDCFNYDLKSS